jgi:hypothetical protein
MPQNDHTLPGSRFGLDWNGALQGQCKSIDPGTFKADVHEAKAGSWLGTNKSVVNIQNPEATAEVGIGMGNNLYQFIKASFDQNYMQGGGAILIADFNGKVQRRLDFLGALMTEFTVPKLSGDSKENGYFTFKWKYESGRWSDGGKEDLNVALGADSFKTFRLNNYRVEIGSLPCDLVASVDALSFKQATAYDQVGIVKEAPIIPTQVSLGDIKLEISKGIGGAAEKAWADAAKKWFIDGVHEDKDELTGRITWLAPNLKDELGSITLEHLGFKEFSYAKLERGDKPARFTVTLYCENYHLKLNKPGA